MNEPCGVDNSLHGIAPAFFILRDDIFRRLTTLYV